MLTLTGTIRAVTTLGGVNKKTGEMSFPLTCAPDRGPRQPWSGSTLHPHSSDTKPFEGRVGEQVSVPVRAWAPGGVREPRL
jgi:hypothetical protein